MADVDKYLQDPEFLKLLSERSRLRWGLTIFLVAVYLGYSMAGIYASDTLAIPFFGTAINWGIALGYLIIGLSIALSLYYVRRINRLVAHQGNAAADDRGSRR